MLITEVTVSGSRWYTHISPSILYATRTVIKISDFPFRLASPKNVRSLWAVLLGTRTNAFFIALLVTY